MDVWTGFSKFQETFHKSYQSHQSETCPTYPGQSSVPYRLTNIGLDQRKQSDSSVFPNHIFVKTVIQLPLQCYPSIQDPIHQLYSDIDFSSVTPQELKGRTILTVNNERSMEINNKVLEFMPGNETVYKAVDMIMSEDPQDQLTFPEEFLNSLTPTGLPPYELKLKIGAL
ncbi:hypothetical protein AVEN_5584-1 [Araneus ventricosus]|uniref:Uncharacterized protein n=1 Tax=Araneus ventricosus TaxID=182803 RepID=A0A4Y2EQT8_ARAVE|nr:hypothetical protein AVEN_5584-1 [Araneus ventricosus]